MSLTEAPGDTEVFLGKINICPKNKLWHIVACLVTPCPPCLREKILCQYVVMMLLFEWTVKLNCCIGVPGDVATDIDRDGQTGDVRWVKIDVDGQCGCATTETGWADV
jgi:hypothetical protein